MKPKFFNFPLVALAYGTSDKQRLETLVMWAIIDVGKRGLRGWIDKVEEDDENSKGEARARLRSLVDKFELDLSYQEEGLEGVEFDALDAEPYDLEECLQCAADYNRLIWALGVETLALNHGWRDCKTCMTGHKSLQAFFDQMRKATGRTGKNPVMVYGMKAKWLLDAHKHLCGNGTRDTVPFTYSHFAVLAAILSKIGNKKTCSTVTWPEIQRRALGYATAEEMKMAQPFRQDGEQPLSRRQIDNRTKQLAVMKFVVRHVPKIGRKAQPAWYSATQTPAELVKTAAATTQKRVGGWQKRYDAMQAKQTTLAQSLTQVSQTPRALPILASARLSGLSAGLLR